MLMRLFFAMMGSFSATFLSAHEPGHEAAGHHALEFSVQSVHNGAWSDPKTWQPARVPKSGDRVLITRGTDVLYDVKSPAVIRLVQVAGKLRFSRKHDTELNVGLLKVQNSLHCSESGFACDFHSANKAGEPEPPRRARCRCWKSARRNRPFLQSTPRKSACIIWKAWIKKMPPPSRVARPAWKSTVPL